MCKCLVSNWGVTRVGPIILYHTSAIGHDMDLCEKRALITAKTPDAFLKNAPNSHLGTATGKTLYDEI